MVYSSPIITTFTLFLGSSMAGYPFSRSPYIQGGYSRYLQTTPAARLLSQPRPFPRQSGDNLPVKAVHLFIRQGFFRAAIADSKGQAALPHRDLLALVDIKQNNLFHQFAPRLPDACSLRIGTHPATWI